MSGWFYVLQLHNNSGRFKVGWTGEERLEKRIGEHRTIMPDLILRAAHHCANEQQEQACIKHLATQSCCQQVNSSEVFEVKSVESFLRTIDAYFGTTISPLAQSSLELVNQLDKLRNADKACFRILTIKLSADLTEEQQVQAVRDAVAKQQAIHPAIGLESMAAFLKDYDGHQHHIEELLAIAPPHNGTVEEKIQYMRELSTGVRDGPDVPTAQTFLRLYRDIEARKMDQDDLHHDRHK